MTLIALVLALLVAAVAVVWLGQRSLMYVPDRQPAPPAAAVLPDGRDVTLTTSDGLDLRAWYVPPTPPCRAAVLVAPGNGGNRAGRAGLARAIHAHGVGVLLLDYRGYADNPGRPSQAGLLRDAEAARAFLSQQASIADDQLIYLGESLGTGVVTALARQHPPAAMVLRSPMTSMADVVRALYHVPVGPLLRDRYPVQQNVAQLTVPLAVVYGSDDTIVPAGQSRAVARTARDAGMPVVEVEVPGADHNDLELAEGSKLISALLTATESAGIAHCRP